ncbi:MAG: hypothetical protein EOQ33_20605 [Mesorhizobium sp.]|nr:MAG: hypothetical protein EOQ33_20605 [Mesorhizobium sp.]
MVPEAGQPLLGRICRSGPGDLADQLLKFTGNKSLIDALLKEAGIAGAGGSLKYLVSTRPRETDADGAGLFEEADVADDELIAPLAGTPKA